jgi:hypothetical protein
MDRILAHAPAACPATPGFWLRFLAACLIGAALLPAKAGSGVAAPPGAPLLALDLLQTLGEGAADGDAVWGDLDDDDDQDILLTGRNNNITQTFYLRNNAGSFSLVTTAMPGTEFGALALADIDLDDDLDVFLTGQTGLQNGQKVGVARIYANNGSGSFTQRHALPNLYRSSGDWGDYDRDGDLDLLVCGFQTGGNGYGALYRNDGSAFIEMTAINVPDVGDCTVRFGDYNEDEYPDFVILGKTTDADAITALTQVFRNNGNGGFVSLPTLGGLWSGSADWFDLENDGDLDLLVTGNVGSLDQPDPVTRLYRFNGSFNLLTTTLPGVWQSSTAWGDYDNDGDLDLLLNGLTKTQHLTRVYLNAGGGSFSDANAGLRSGTGGSVAWGHLDSNRSLDLVLTGIENTDTTISTFVYRSTPSTANTPPSTPSLTLGCWDSDSRVFLQWNDSVDGQTSPGSGLTYNLRVGTGPGEADVVNPAADNNGLRLLAEPGNVESNSFTVLRGLPHRDYYWSVQAVDSAYLGGPFSLEGRFNVGVRVAQDDSGYVTAENTPLEIPVLENDLDDYGDLEIVSVDNPPHGSAAEVGDSIRYTPDSSYAGMDTFGYFAAASQGHCSRALISVMITGLNLTNRKVQEGLPTGTQVGTFSTVDPDAPAESFTYTLVAGDGSADNSAFTIAGNSLLTAEEFDYETKNSYTIRVRSTGSQGSVYEKAFTIQVIAPPTGIQLSPDTVAENQPVTTVVGAFTSSDPEPGSSFTYQLVGGSGSADNGSFTIIGDQLRTAAVFDYETKNTYSIRVRTTDNHGLTFEKAFTVHVSFTGGITPTDIALSDNSVPENEPADTVVGVFTSSDPEPGATFTYQLVGGSGDADNDSFNILNDRLRTAAVFDYEKKNIYTIRVRSTDNHGLYLEESFTIQVTDEDESTGIRLSNEVTYVGLPPNTPVGHFSTVGGVPPYTYSLASGPGCTHTNLFVLYGSALLTYRTYTRDDDSAMTICVRSTDDDGHSLVASFVISVRRRFFLPEVKAP